MRVQVTSVGPVEQKTSAKKNQFGKYSTYQQLEVQFLSNGRANKKQIMSFNPNGVFDTLLAAPEGQEYDVTTKESGAYTNWDSVEPVASEDPATVVPSS